VKALAHRHRQAFGDRWEGQGATQSRCPNVTPLQAGLTKMIYHFRFASAGKPNNLLTNKVKVKLLFHT
jgi:hypothetical protein